MRITSPNGTDAVGRKGDRPIDLRGKPAEKPGETVNRATAPKALFTDAGRP